MYNFAYLALSSFVLSNSGNDFMSDLDTSHMVAVHSKHCSSEPVLSVCTVDINTRNLTQSPHCTLQTLIASIHEGSVVAGALDVDIDVGLGQDQVQEAGVVAGVVECRPTADITNVEDIHTQRYTSLGFLDIMIIVGLEELLF